MNKILDFRRVIALALTVFAMVGAVPSQAAGSGIVERLFVAPGAGAVPRLQNEKLSERLSIKDFGAKGDGTTEDTAAINAAFEAARVAKKCVYAPAGTYIVQQLLFGTQATEAQSVAPACLYGDAWQTTFKAKAGFTGTVLKAWSIVGVVFENFEIDGNNTAVTCIDSEWKPGAGPSTQNRYVNIRCNGATGTGWNAKNNSDAVFDRVVINGAGHDKTCLDFTATGGLAWVLNSIWNNCSLKFGAQNGVIRDSWGHGIQFAQGALNYVELSGVYLYWNTSMQAVLKSESFVSFQSVHGLTAIGSQFIGPDSASAGGIIDLNAYSHLDFVGSQFITSGTVNMFGPNARGDSYEKPIVLFQGGSSNFTPNSTSVFDVNFDGFMNDATGHFFPNKRTSVYASSGNGGSYGTNTWYDLIQPGTLEEGDYVISFAWQHNGAGVPYIVRASAMVSVALTNGSGSGSTITASTIDHVGNGYQISLRAKAGADQMAGVQFMSSVALPSPGSYTWTATKIGR